MSEPPPQQPPSPLKCFAELTIAKIIIKANAIHIITVDTVNHLLILVMQNTHNNKILFFIILFFSQVKKSIAQIIEPNVKTSKSTFKTTI